MSKTYHPQCSEKLTADKIATFKGNSKYDGTCAGCQKPFAAGDRIAYYKEDKLPAAYKVGGDAHQDAPNIDWPEADRFDKWIKNNAGALRIKIGEMKEADPRLRLVKSIVVASQIYLESFGANVQFQLDLAGRPV